MPVCFRYISLLLYQVALRLLGIWFILNEKLLTTWRIGELWKVTLCVLYYIAFNILTEFSLVCLKVSCDCDTIPHFLPPDDNDIFKWKFLINFHHKSKSHNLIFLSFIKVWMAFLILRWAFHMVNRFFISICQVGCSVFLFCLCIRRQHICLGC